MALQSNEETQPLNTNDNSNSSARPHAVSALDSEQEITLDPNIDQITCGLSWDFFDKKIDLDVTVVALDTYSFELDAAYYKQPSIFDGAIQHSGDNKTGKGDGDDEQIRISTSKLPQKCKSLWFIVNAFSGGSFTDVESARFTLYDATNNNKVLYSYGIGMAFNSTALLLGVLSVNDPYSNDKQWSFKMIEKKGSGSNFVESKYLLEENLTVLYDEGILCERPNDRKKKYDLTKGDLYVIDPSIHKLQVGLGWDASSRGDNIDVDASVIIFSKNESNYRQEAIVSYANLNYQNAIVHAGDNRTGAGSGDDETIKINLRHWDQPNSSGTVPVLCVVINIYSGSASFKNIRNCFARLIDDNNRELCRFNLTEEQDTEAMIMCHIERRVTGLWGMSADGVGCSGRVAGKSASDAIGMLRGDTVTGQPLGMRHYIPSNLVPAPDNEGNCCCLLM